MGPKKATGAGRKGGNPPPKEDDPSEHVTMLMKQMFEIQMVDIEKKIDRLQKRKVELTELTEKLEQSIAEHQKERGALIEETRAEYQLKEDEKQMKRDRVGFLENEAREYKKKLENGIEERKGKYDDMVQELTKKLDEMEEDYKILEDFKSHKGEYLRKVEETDKEREEAERQHQRNLFAILQKLEMAKFRLKKGAESRLLLLSLEFQETSRIKIGHTVHRMLQENRAIDNELKSIKTAMWDYQVGYEAAREGKKMIRQREKLMVEEKEKFVARCIIQRNIIKALQKKNEELTKTLKKYLPLQMENETLVRKHKILETQVEKKKTEIAEVGWVMSAKKDEASKMSDASAFMKRTMRKLQILLRNALRSAEEALILQVIPMGETEEEAYLSMETKLKLYQKRRNVVFKKKGKILKNLQEIILRAQMTDEEWKILSAESIGLERLDFVGIFTSRSVGQVVQEELPVDRKTESKASLVVSGSDTSLPRSVETIDEFEMDQSEEEEEEEEKILEKSEVGKIIKVVQEEEEDVEWGGEGGEFFLPEETGADTSEEEV